METDKLILRKMTEEEYKEHFGDLEKSKSSHTLEEYQEMLRLFDFEMPYFKAFLEDPNQKEFHPSRRMVLKNDDGSLQLEIGFFQKSNISIGINGYSKE